MTTPSSNTPIYVIEDAMREAKLLQPGDSPNSDTLAVNMRKLNDLINVWMTRGLKLWLNVDIPITLVDGTRTYTLGPGGAVDMTRPLRAITAYFLDNNTPPNSRPINILSWTDYLSLGQRTQEGGLTSIFIDKGQLFMTVYCWPVPDATAALGTLHILWQTQVSGPISLTETMNFPIEWRMALVWGLANEICSGQPASVIDRCTRMSEQYRTALEDWDIENVPVRFTPNLTMSSYGPSGSFR